MNIQTKYDYGQIVWINTLDGKHPLTKGKVVRIHVDSEITYKISYSTKTDGFKSDIHPEKVVYKTARELADALFDQVAHKEQMGEMD